MREKIRKILALFVTLLMVLSMFPSTVLGENGIIVNVTISESGSIVKDKGAELLAGREISLSGKESYTVDDVLKKVHELYNENGAESYATEEGPYGLSITKLWNDASGQYGYYINGGLAFSLTDAVNDGDTVEAAILQNTYPDTENYAKFESFSKTAVMGEEVDFTLSQGGFDESFNLVFSPCADAIITIDGAETDFKTDSEGKAAVVFEKGGRHIVSASKVKTLGGNTVTAISAPVCAVDVAYWAQSGSEDDPYLIESQNDIVKLAKLCNADGVTFAGKHFKMTNDIELPEGWTPIGALKEGATATGNGKNINPFCGSFDGNGHTVTVPEGGLPLFGYVREANISNLNIYGVKINGCGLVGNYSTDYGEDGINKTATNPQYTAVIDNCCLKSGSSTLRSGFIGGYASGVNKVTVKNCTVEANVTVGYTKEESNIGSVTGELNGTVINCVSYADVYGVDFVGGICANKGQTLGNFGIYDCVFGGNIDATGNYVGGILAAGYGGAGFGFSANSPWPTVQNCMASGDIKGGNYVGGILGAEPGTLECWENGVGYIQNNLFTGSVSASAVDAYIGGVIGFIKAADRYTVISNNYFADTCGAQKGIGDIEIVETLESNETIGSGFYKATLNGAKYGREDDPKGADAQKLAKAYAQAEMADGSVVRYLNSGLNSNGDWILSGETAAFGGKRHIVFISSPKLSAKTGVTQYVNGDDALDGIEIILTYSDGDIETINAVDAVKQYELSDNLAGSSIAASVAYNNHQIVFMMNIKEGGTPSGDTPGGSGTGNNISVKFTLYGDAVHGEGTTHTLKANNLKKWISETTVSVPKNSTVMDVFAKVLNKNGYSWLNDKKSNSSSGNYIESITTRDGTTLAEFDNGPNSGWMYTLNGKYSLSGINEQTLKDGDVVVFHYTDDYLIEKSQEEFGGGGGAGAASIKYTVKFDSNGGTAVENQSISQNSQVSNPENPQKDGFVFGGWYIDKELTQKYDFSQKVTGQLTLYAKWIESPKADEVFFADVEKDEWYYEPIKYVCENKLMKGTSKTSFSPADSLTRAMLVTILYRMENEPETTACGFSDVADGTWYAAAVGWAAANGIVNGVSENEFAPESSITREQMAVIMHRYAKMKGYDVSVGENTNILSYDDFDGISEFAIPALQWTAGSGIMAGKTGSTLNPADSASRAETAAVIMRLIYAVQ